MARIFKDPPKKGQDVIMPGEKSGRPQSPPASRLRTVKAKPVKIRQIDIDEDQKKDMDRVSARDYWKKRPVTDKDVRRPDTGHPLQSGELFEATHRPLTKEEGAAFWADLDGAHDFYGRVRKARLQKGRTDRSYLRTHEKIVDDWLAPFSRDNQ